MQQTTDMLSQAILKQDLAAVEHYLTLPIDLNQRDSYGYTPLIEACIVNNFDLASMLLTKGADPNQQDITGATALHWATENNNIELAKALLEHEADPNIYSTASESPLVVPYLRRQSAMLELLTTHGGSLTVCQRLY